MFSPYRAFGEFLVALGFLVGSSAFLAGQTAVTRTNIVGEASCATCTIELEHVARLGDDPEGFIVGWPLVLSKDSRDRWFVFGPGIESQPKVYNYDGSFLRSIGREGEGPGEFSSVISVHEHPKDTLNFWDAGNHRVSRFTVGFEYIDQQRILLNPRYLIFTTEGRIAINANLLTRADPDLPLHLLGPDGKVSTSFGIPQMPFRDNDHRHEIWRICASGSGGIWAAPLPRYEIQHWDSEGTYTQVVSREVTWFQPHRDPATRTDPEGRPPNPKVKALQEDGEGRVWTAVYVAQSNWEEGFMDITLRSGLIYRQPYEEEQYDTRVEVLDPVKGTALATLTVPQAVGGFVGTGRGGVYLYGLHRLPSGEPFVDIWLARLIGEPGT